MLKFSLLENKTISNKDILLTPKINKGYFAEHS